MKTRHPILSVILISFAVTSFSQNKVLPEKNFFAVKTDLIFLVPNFYKNTWSGKLSIEKGFAKRHSVQFSSGFLLENKPQNLELFLVPEYKFYFKDHGFKGFYAGVYFKNYFGRQKYLTGLSMNDYGLVDHHGYGAGVSLGYQFYVAKHLTVDFLLGGGFIYNTVKIKRTVNDKLNDISLMRGYPFTRVDGRLCINIGYKF